MGDIKVLETRRANEENPIAVAIMDQAGEETLGYINVRGADSEAVRRASHRTADEWIGLSDDERDESADERDGRLYESRVARVVAAAVSFDPPEPDGERWTDGGEPLEFNEENLRRLLAFSFVLTQVEVAMRNHADFFERQSGSL